MDTNNPINSVVAELEPFFERILMTGSRVICSPPPEGTDEDYILLVKKEKLEDFVNTLEARDWYQGGSMFVSPDKRRDLQEKHTFNQDGSVSNENLFLSFKRQEDIGVYNEDPDPDDEDDQPEYLVEPSGPILNILVTCNQEYFDDFTRATYLAKALNLTSKADRVILFEALTRDSWPDPNKKQEPKKKGKYIYKTVDWGSLYNGLSSAPAASAVNTIMDMITPQTITATEF